MGILMSYYYGGDFKVKAKQYFLKTHLLFTPLEENTHRKLHFDSLGAHVRKSVASLEQKIPVGFEVRRHSSLPCGSSRWGDIFLSL
ncbi:MAG: hypothetical protein ACRCU6_11530 [Fusobacteriaceae bacterium]